MLRIKRVRRTSATGAPIVDYAAVVSPVGFVEAFTPDAAKAGQFRPDLCSLVQANYAPHQAAGDLTAEPVPEPVPVPQVKPLATLVAEPKRPLAKSRNR